MCAYFRWVVLGLVFAGATIGGLSQAQQRSSDAAQISAHASPPTASFLLLPAAIRPTAQLDNRLASPGAVYTWTPPLAGLNDWAIATNWAPARVAPSPSDVLIIDGNITPAPFIKNVAGANIGNSETISGLQIVGGAQVHMWASNTPKTLVVNNSTAGPGLDLQATASLSVETSSSATDDPQPMPLTISIPGGASGSGYGQLVFQDLAHHLIADQANAVFVTGLVTLAKSYPSGAYPFGNGSSGNGGAGSIVFQDGSAYFHNNGQSPFGTEGNGPVTVFQTGSEANWLTTQGFQASGRTYADLILGNPSTNVNISLSGITGNFQVDDLTLYSSTAAPVLQLDGSAPSGPLCSAARSHESNDRPDTGIRIAPMLRIGTVFGSPDKLVEIPIEGDMSGAEVIAQFTVHFERPYLSISDFAGTNVNPDISLGDGLPDGARVTVNTSQIANGDIGLVINFNGEGSSKAMTASRGTKQLLVIRFRLVNEIKLGSSLPVTFGDGVFVTKLSDELGRPIEMSGGLVGGAVVVSESVKSVKKRT